MPKYRVRLARAVWFTMDVEADNEDEAHDLAADEAPELSAQDAGWGHKWTQEADEWMSMEDYYGAEYNPETHGPTVAPLPDDAPVGRINDW